MLSRPSDDPDSLLQELFELGRQTHPGLVLPAEAFQAAVLERVAVRLGRVCGEPGAAGTLDVLRTTSGADLHLVVCCDQGVPGAWERLTQGYGPRVRKLALHLRCSDVDAICTDLLSDLSSPSTKPWARTRLGTYLGAGTLFAWLGVILRRRLADAARTRRPPHVGIARAPAAPPEDPLERALVDELADRIRELLHVAWEGLDDNERMVLLFKYREGMGQRAIASLMQLSESRISRIVSRALTRLRTSLVGRIDRELPGRWPDEDRLWHALMHVVAMHLSKAGPIEDRDTARRTRHG